jgi:hypothetical protein
MLDENKYILGLKEWLGEEGIRYFKHLKGLKGDVFPVLKLNVKTKGMPVYPVHFREGSQIRNWLSSTYPEIMDELKEWDAFEDWTHDIMNKLVLNK